MDQAKEKQTRRNSNDNWNENFQKNSSSKPQSENNNPYRGKIKKNKKPKKSGNFSCKNIGDIYKKIQDHLEYRRKFEAEEELVKLAKEAKAAIEAAGKKKAAEEAEKIIKAEKDAAVKVKAAKEAAKVLIFEIAEKVKAAEEAAAKVKAKEEASAKLKAALKSARELSSEIEAKEKAALEAAKKKAAEITAKVIAALKAAKSKASEIAAKVKINAEAKKKILPKLVSYDQISTINSNTEDDEEEFTETELEEMNKFFVSDANWERANVKSRQALNKIKLANLEKNNQLAIKQAENIYLAALENSQNLESNFLKEFPFKNEIKLYYKNTTKANGLGEFFKYDYKEKLKAMEKAAGEKKIKEDLEAKRKKEEEENIAKEREVLIIKKKPKKKGSTNQFVKKIKRKIPPKEKQISDIN